MSLNDQMAFEALIGKYYYYPFVTNILTYNYIFATLYQCINESSHKQYSVDPFLSRLHLSKSRPFGFPYHKSFSPPLARKIDHKHPIQNSTTAILKLKQNMYTPESMCT